MATPPLSAAFLKKSLTAYKVKLNHGVAIKRLCGFVFLVGNAFMHSVRVHYIKTCGRDKSLPYDVSFVKF